MHDLRFHRFQVNLSILHEGVDLLLLLLKCLKHHLESFLLLRLLWEDHWLWDLFYGVHVLLGGEYLLLDVVHLLLNHCK